MPVPGVNGTIRRNGAWARRSGAGAGRLGRGAEGRQGQNQGGACAAESQPWFSPLGLYANDYAEPAARHNPWIP